MRELTSKELRDVSSGRCPVCHRAEFTRLGSGSVTTYTCNACRSIWHTDARGASGRLSALGKRAKETSSER